MLTFSLAKYSQICFKEISPHLIYLRCSSGNQKRFSEVYLSTLQGCKIFHSLPRMLEISVIILVHLVKYYERLDLPVQIDSSHQALTQCGLQSL